MLENFPYARGVFFCHSKDNNFNTTDDKLVIAQRKLEVSKLQGDPKQTGIFQTDRQNLRIPNARFMKILTINQYYSKFL